MRWEPTKSTLQSHALKLVDGREDAVEAITMTSIEFVTSMLVYPLYIKQVWLYFDNQPQRGAKVHGGCASDVQVKLFFLQTFEGRRVTFVCNQAGLLMSSLAEMGAAFTLQVTALILAANIKNIILRTLIQVTVLFFLVIACKILTICKANFRFVTEESMQAMMFLGVISTHRKPLQFKLDVTTWSSTSIFSATGLPPLSGLSWGL